MSLREPGTGDNEPLGPDQVEPAVPDAIPDQVATDAGVFRDRAADRADQELPQVMAKLNPAAGSLGRPRSRT